LGFSANPFTTKITSQTTIDRQPHSRPLPAAAIAARRHQLVTRYRNKKRKDETRLPQPNIDTVPQRRPAFFIPAGLLIAVLVSLAIDLPVAAYFKRGDSPRLFAEFLENVEPFGHGFGAALVVITVLVLDPPRRRQIPVLLAGSLGAGAAANIVKLIVVRTRPRNLEPLPATVWETFNGWFFQNRGGDSNSFPSAHTATAMGLAVILAAFYPRGRWYFPALAILVGMQRVHSGAHFPSDVFAGAIVGWCVATGCLALDNRRMPLSR
jgi:membrane-associated phospholipid phosphatase